LTEEEIMGKGRRKGFRRKKRPISDPVALDTLDPIATTVERLEMLLGEILQHKQLSPRCYGMMKHLAHMPPAVRLATNLKTVLDVLMTKEVSNMLQDALTRDEREVLMAIDASSMSLESRRTAHSLLNVDTRVREMTALHKLFRDMGTRRSHVLEDKPLD
jgi:hypothetical protein